MSREAFVPPTLINPPTSGGAGAANASSTGLNDQGKPVRYRCGECSKIVLLRRADIVRCDECGHRVLYKERTQRMVQFEAR